MRYLIPIASDTNLFPKEDYHFPKPLIEINGVPMIGYVIDHIKRRDAAAKFLFVVQKRDCVEFSLDSALKLLAGDDTVIVPLERPTLGSVCSALMAIDHIDDDQPLVICNGDQLIEADLSAINGHFGAEDFDAGLITFSSVHPRWSYVRTDGNGDVIETAEKRVLSRQAIAGYYYYKSGHAFVQAAQSYLMKSESVNGRFYLSPTMNEIILGGGKVGQVEIPTDAYVSFYSPQRVEFYQNSPRGQKSMTEQTKKAVPVQVVIPMAGLGSRFSQAGYDKPKPFIDVKGKPMIARVMDNLHVENARFVLIARQEHLDAEPGVRTALETNHNLVFAPIDFVTEGAACTVLTARKHLDMDAPLLIANCDQIVDFVCKDYINDAVARGLDGSILVFRDKDRDPKWSFAKLGDNDLVTEVREKVAISDIATVGLYYFRRAQDFIDGATDMIARRDRVNNEYYVCPVYNYLISSSAKIGVYYVEPDAMHGIGTPPDLDAYLQLLP